ncbi:Exodeoxyribonuclease VII large subunit [plant metagenome]|uniref:Exodeoxyribonuclease VII large subunit n=1 Tax=plant metagenome TaxID=1297885 RepID=A0A484UFR7_9ZZZZ
MAARRPLARREARLEVLRTRLAHRRPDVRRAAERLARVQAALAQAGRRLTPARQAALQALSGQLRALDPQQTLARGYAIARDTDGRIVRDAGTLARGARLSLRFARGEAQADVRDVTPEDGAA